MSERTLFIKALEIADPIQRAALLKHECASDLGLRERVEKLLAAHAAAGGILDQPAVESPPTDLFRPISEGPGTVIGPYKLLQQIGEGGFGVVYMAEQQQPVRRKVAFKIIKPGMDTREVIARFESERQALALMDHPNIARVLDAGATDSGRPYFVMELVKGVPITEYCDKNNLAADKRLDLFVTVCNAVQHAHQKGVIHRDIKPTNVMVTLHDGKPVPKVIDFGVAKATSQQLTEKTLFTAYGQMIGTPAYMSPEQAEMSGLDIDTRSDIYSLGVLLYELLTGTTPFDGKRLRDAGYVEMQRIIREEDPPRPSTRVSTLGEKLTVVSSHRSTDPKSLRQTLSGDLDLIVMKAMEKERTRRYDTPSNFAADIERYLSQEPVLARAPSAAYKLRKFVQRNKAGVTAAAAVAGSLLVGLILSTGLAIFALGQRSQLAEANSDLSSAKTAVSEQLAQVQRQNEAIGKLNKDLSLQTNAAEEGQREAIAARNNEAAQLAVAKAERDKATALSDELKRERDELDRRKEQQRRMLYVAQMNLIEKAWNDDNVVRVQELLNATRPRSGESDLRGIEWHYWQRMMHQEERSFKLPTRLARSAIGFGATPSSGFAGGISAPSFRFSADGTRLAVITSAESGTDADYALKVWNTETGSEPVFTHTLPREPAAPPPSLDNPPAQSQTPFSTSTFGSRTPATNYSIAFVDADRVVISRPVRSAAAPAALRDLFERARDASPEEREKLDEERARLSQQSALPEFHLRSFALNARPASAESLASPVIVHGSFAFSRDGSHLATLAKPIAENEPPPLAMLQILDGRSGAVLQQVPSPFPFATILALSADAARMALTESRQSSIPLPGGTRGFRPPPADQQITILEVPTRHTVSVQAAGLSGFQSRLGPDFACEFSPDGTRLAIGPRNPTSPFATTLVDAATGTQLATTTSSSGIRTSATFGRSSNRFLVFSPDGKWLVSPSVVDAANLNLTLYEVSNLQAGHQIKGHTAAPVLAAFSSDGSRLTVADESGAIKVWRLPSQTTDGPSESRQLPSPPADGPAESQRLAAGTARSGASSSDGRWRAAWLTSRGRADATIEPPYEVTLMDFSRPAQPRVLNVSGPVQAGEFSPDGTLLAVVCVDPAANLDQAAELSVWSVSDGKPVPLPRPQFAATLTRSDFDRGSTPSKAKTRPRPEFTRRTSSATFAFSPDSRRLALVPDATTTRQGTQSDVRLWDLSRRREVPVTIPRLTSRLPLSPTFSPDSKLLLLSSRGRSTGSTFGASPIPRPSASGLQVIEAATGGLLWQDDADVTDPVFSGDSTRVAGIARDDARTVQTARAVVIWDAATGEPAGRVPLRRMFESLTLNHDGSKVALSNFSGVTVYDIATEAELYSLDGGTVSTEFSRDDQRIVTLSAPAGLPLQFQRFLRSAPPEILSSVSSGGRVKVWDAQTGQELLAVSTDSPLFAAFRPGKELTPLAPQVEAESFVDWLTAADADGRFLTRGQISERLKTDPSLSDEARAIALRLAASIRRSPAGLLSQAHAIVESSDLPREEYERAREWIREALEQTPEDGNVLNRLGMAHYRLGDYASALTVLERANVERSKARTITGPPFSLVFLAMTHHQLGHAEEARKFFYEADRMKQTTSRLSPSGYATFEDFLAARGGPFSSVASSRYDALAEAAALLGLPTASALIAKGSLLRTARRRDEALAEYDAAIAIDPENPRAWLERSWTWGDMGRYDKSIADADAALRLDPNLALAYNARGIAWGGKQDFDKAIQDYSEAIRIDPRNPAYLGNRGFARARQGRLDEAMEDINAAFRISANYAHAFYYRGYVSERQGDDAGALADYDRAIEGTLSRKVAAFYGRRAGVQRRLGNFEQALADYDEATGLEPKHADYRRGRAMVKRDQGDLEQALVDFDKAISLDSKFTRAYLGRGIAWQLKGDQDKASADFRQALDLGRQAGENSQWKNPDDLENLAAAHAELGNFAEAEKFQQQAISLLPPTADKTAYESRLALYREGKPYRESPAAKAASNQPQATAGSEN